MKKSILIILIFLVSLIFIILIPYPFDLLNNLSPLIVLKGDNSVLVEEKLPIDKSKIIEGLSDILINDAAPQETLNNINRYKEQLKDAKISFILPKFMIVKQSEIVEAIIAYDNSVIEEVEPRADVSKTEPIKISPFIKAKLISIDFKIEALSSENQALPEQGAAKWSWKITPEETGQKILKLDIYSRIKIPNYSDEEFFLKSFTKSIVVKVDSASISEENWKWMIENLDKILLILTPISLAILSQWKKLSKWFSSRMKNSNKQLEPKTNHSPIVTTKASSNSNQNINNEDKKNN